MADVIGDEIEKLRIHEDGDVVLRGGADDAFAAWSEAAVWSEENEANGEGDDAWTEDTKRCVLPDADPFWDEISSTSRLEVVVKPHRTQHLDGGVEHLVNSIRPFTVLVTLIDPGSDRAISGWQTTLRARLVYADSGEPVPSQRGESPLSGELEKPLASTGEACALRLRVAALSHNHGRRAFAVLIEADELPGGRRLESATSGPVRTVARLPNVAAAPSGGARPAPAAVAAAGPLHQQTAPVHAAPTTAIVEDAGHDWSDSDSDDDDDDMSTHSSLPGRSRPQASAHGLALPSRFGSPSSMATQSSFTSDAADGYPAACGVPCHFGASCHGAQPGLIAELRAQGELLQRVLAQQRQIMGEMQQMRISAPAVPLT